jgi:hypothetical protein
VECQFFQYRRQIRSNYKQLDTHQHDKRALGAMVSHGSVDWQ